MGALDGRVAAITGAGRGIGREHALFFAREGAHVVVNDLGAAADGTGANGGPAAEVVEEIVAAGGTAVANVDNVATWAGAARLIDTAVESFGRLDVLVNNAGILRDAYLAGMTEADWDGVIQVHLKGHFAPLRHAAAYWKARRAAGEEVRAAVVNTSSASGVLLANAGQANYGVAKAGIAALTLVAAAELGRYGVRVNAIAPMARTRLTQATPGLDALFEAPADPDAFDPLHPGHAAPIAAYLSTGDCPVTGRVFSVQGGAIAELSGWHVVRTAETDGPWTVAGIADRLAAWGSAGVEG